ncbi:MAG: hypothetical protein GY801_10580 [bacterium]|nr:hypothetical protein [bacterium]
MSDPAYNDTQQPQTEGRYVKMDRDLSIDDLSYQDAREYVMSFLTAEKKTEKLLQEKQQDFDRWNKRLAYAEQQGTSEQLERIQRELHVLIRERDTLKAEREQLHRKNVVLKEKLQAKARNADTTAGSTRAEKLLADFGELVDIEEYKLQEAVKEQEADDELAKLKAKLSKEQH